MAGTLARHRMFSDMDYTDYMNYMDHMRKPWDPGFIHRNEDMLDYKLFFARKLKSIFTEQNRLRQHLVQIADLEWDLKQHYYLYGDEYRSGRLGDRYRRLQSRIQQMQDENSFLQSRTGLRLERYMLAQTALSDLSDECCATMSGVNDMYDDTDAFDAQRRRTRNDRMLASGLCTPDMLCRAYSTSNSEQVYDRYEDDINALFEIERKRHVEEYIKSRERCLHSEAPRTDSQSRFQKLETLFDTSIDGPDTHLNVSPVIASRTSNSFHKPSVVTAEVAVQVSPRDMVSTFSNERSKPVPPEPSHYFPDEAVRAAHFPTPNFSESVSKESINEYLKANSSRDRPPVPSLAPPMVKPDACPETSFRNISESQTNYNMPKESSDGGSNVPLMPPPMVKPEAILGGFSGNNSNTQPDNRFQKESSDGGPNETLMPPPKVKPEAIHGSLSGNTPTTQPDNRFQRGSSDSVPSVPLIPPPMVKPEALLGGFPRNGFTKDISDVSLGEYFSKGSASTLKNSHSLPKPRIESNQRFANIFDRLDGDFKENLNNSQRTSIEKGRPVPEWADQIVEGIKRNLIEQHEQSKALQRDARKTMSEDDQDQTDYSSSDSHQVNAPRKRASNRRRSRIPVRKPAKTLVYTSEDKDKVLKNVKMCMIKDREFNIVSQFKRYGKK